MAVTLHVNKKSEQRLLRKMSRMRDGANKEVWKLILSTGLKIEDTAAENLKNMSSKTGKNYTSMIQSFTRRLKRLRLNYQVVNTHKAAAFFEFGTKPHVIKIKNKKVLAGITEDVGGKASSKYKGTEYTFFGKKVQHPGTKKRPFMKSASIKHKAEYIKRLQKLIPQLARKK